MREFNNWSSPLSADQFLSVSLGFAAYLPNAVRSLQIPFFFCALSYHTTHLTRKEQTDPNSLKMFRSSCTSILPPIHLLSLISSSPAHTRFTLKRSLGTLIVALTLTSFSIAEGFINLMPSYRLTESSPRASCHKPLSIKYSPPHTSPLIILPLSDWVSQAVEQS